jgi:chitodextrinase
MWGAAPRTCRILALLGISAVGVLACVSGGSAGLPVDPTPPTTPSNLTVTSITANSVTVSWSPSTDNIAVTGYGHFLNGAFVNTGTTTSFTWTGLSCGTGYALAVDAFDARGNHSSQASLTASTTSCASDTTRPSPVNNLQVTATAQTSITLGWLPATDNVGVAGYNVYASGTKVGSTTNLGYTLTGLSCATSYALAVETFDAAGNVSDKSLTTTNQSTTACSAAPASRIGTTTIGPRPNSSPAGEVRAGVTTATSSGQINELHVYLDTPTTATSVKVGIYADGASKPAMRLAAGTITAPQKGTWNAAAITPISIAAGTNYWIAVLGVGGTLAYRDNCCGSGTPVRANAGTLTELPLKWAGGAYAGNDGPVSAYGTNSTASPSPPPPPPPPPTNPPPADTTAPSTPTGLAVANTTTTSLTLSWAASSDNVGVTGYGHYKNGSLLTTSTGTSYAFTGLTCGTTYTLAIDATDAAGNRSSKAQTTAATTPCGDTQAPTAPSGLTVSSATPTSISLAWSPATDNVGVTGYGHYQNTSLISTSAGTSYTFSGLTCGNAYTLGVDATDAAGNRSVKTQITVSTSACPVAGTTVGNTTVEAQDDSSPAGEVEAAQTTAGATGQVNELQVYLSSRNAASTVKIGLYSDSGGRPGALLASGTVATVQNGAWNTASITPVSVTAGNPYWIAILGLGGTIAYRDRCCGSGTPVQTAAGVLSAMPSLWTTGTYVGRDGPLSAYGDWSSSTSPPPPPAPGADTTPPSTPSALAISSASQTAVTLSWTAASDNFGVIGYGHYRNGTLLDTGSPTSYTFTGLSCGTTYTLAVDATDAAGNRSSKAQLSASTSACSTGGGSATLFMSPSGSDTSSCTQPQPCKSFNRAYDLAAPGASVEVAGGSYPGQTINPDSSKTSTSDVVFRPAAGASVTVTGEIEANGAHFELRDMTINQINFPRSADDITLRNVINHGMWMQGPSNISILGGEITCGTCNYHSHIQNASDGHPPTNILWDGVNFHDWASQAGEHVECLQILGGDNVTIRDSIFKNCGTANGGLGATADLHIAWVATGSAMTKNILLENNFFYPSGNPYAIQMDDYANIDLRNNSISGPIKIWDRSGPGTGIDITGNILRASQCTAESSGVAINWRYNVIQGGTCGSTDKNAAAGFVDASNNLHLATASAAINAGDPANYPTTDIDGQGRPIGGAPDAGGDETGTASAPLPPPPSTDSSDTTPPSPVSGLRVSAATQTSVTYAWNPATDNVGVSGYNMFRGGIMVGFTSALTYTFSNLICGTTYTFAVQTQDSSGNTSDVAYATNVASTSPCSGSSDTSPPSTPTNLTATAATSTSITVNWTASTDNVGVAAYTVYNGSNVAGTTNGSSYTISGLTCGTGFTIGVVASDAAGNSSGKTQITASTGPCASPPPSSGGANLWIDPSGGSCTRSATTVAYSDAAGCTWNGAYQAARSGDVILVKAGSYPVTTIGPTNTALTAPVTMQPESGATVNVDSLTTSGNYVTLKDFTIPTGSNHARGWFNTASNITLDNVDVTGPWANVKITGGNNVAWKNSGLGTPGNTAKRLCAQGDGEPMELSDVSNLLLSNIDFYPFQPELGNPVCGPDSNMHLETIRVWDGVTNWRLERSRFHRGDGSGSARVFFSKISGPDPANITFVNNWFGSSSGTVSIYLTANSPCNNFVFAYNAWEQGFVDQCTPKNGLVLVGNTGTEPNYLPCMGTVNTRNLWVWNAAGSCGTDQWVLDPSNSLGALKYASDGYHLQAGSPAINAGESTLCAQYTGGVDIDGRPRSGTCDAGPDEFGN